MPSKRKKNKRRMRRVQAQRRALEDQHAANPPIKTGPGIAASTPPTAPKKAAKTEKKVPQAVPVVAAVVQIPKAEPELVVKEPEPVPVQAAEAEPEVLDQAPAEVKAEPGAPSDFELEARAGVTEEPPVEWTPPVEPSTGQTGVLQEVIVPQTEAVSEIKPPDEAAVGVPAVTETIEAAITETEAEQSHGVCGPEAEEGAETFAEESMEVRVEVEEDVTDFCAAEPGTEATKEPAAEDFSRDHVSAQAETEAITETPKPEESTESIGPAASASAQERERSAEADVSVEEDEAAVCAEPAAAAEVTDTILEALEEEAEAVVTEAREEVTESLVDVVSESTPGVEAVITPAVIQQEITATSDNIRTQTTSDNIRTQTESIPGNPADPELVAAPAEGALASDAADQMCLNVSSEEPKSEVCDVPCQIQLPVEPVQHDSVEISVETTLNGHMVPEVSIEDAPWSF